MRRIFVGIYWILMESVKEPTGGLSYADNKGISADNVKGLILAVSSSFFIGASFIVKKKGLKKAGSSGLRAGNNSLYFYYLLALICNVYGFLFCVYTLISFGFYS